LRFVESQNIPEPPVEQKALDFLAAGKVPTNDPRYRNALFHLLTAETSCYRCWGEGVWTDYGREIAERSIRIGENDL